MTTAVTSQVLFYIQKVKTSIRARQEQQRLPGRDTDPEARLLGLEKANPVVSKPAP